MLNPFLMTFLLLLLVLCEGSLLSRLVKRIADPVWMKRTDYDEEYAKRMLNLAAGAYAFSADACIQKTFSAGHKFMLLRSVNQTCDAYNNLCSFYVVVSEPTKEMIVVFRGTKSKKQLFTEGWQSMQPGVDFYGVGMVNKYFFRALNSLWTGLLPALSEAKYKDYRLTFTGHSLGGALASLAALRVVLENLKASKQIKLYTFGQPRVGCSRFAAKHDELISHSYRVINRLDIVPHLPPCAKNLHDPRLVNGADSKPCDPDASAIAYHHGTEIWYSNGMSEGSKYYECLGTPKDEDFDCSDSMSFELSKYEIYISDHRHYFDHKVPSFGKLGCNANKVMEENLPNDALNGTEPYQQHKSKHNFEQIAKTALRFLGLRNNK